MTPGRRTTSVLETIILSLLGPARFAGLLLVLLLALTSAGCSSTRPATSTPTSKRGFDFARDTFAFPNETYWVYRPEPGTDRMMHENRVPPPEYAHRCFVVARSAKQFHLHARFVPDAPLVSDAEYRRRIRRVVDRSACRESAEEKRVEFPGYANLRAFSDAHGDLLRDEMGGAWQSYTQRGHWRMVFPFGPSHQQRQAEALARRFAGDSVAEPVVIHVVRFPALTINHALVMFGAQETPGEIRFDVYDPNEPGQPLTLVFDRATRRFTLPATPYFVGGRVDVYEVYRSWMY